MAGKADIVNGIVDLTAVFQPVEDEDDGSSTVEVSISTTDDKYSSKPGG
jgi:hypothetical protein